MTGTRAHTDNTRRGPTASAPTTRGEDGGELRAHGEDDAVRLAGRTRVMEGAAGMTRGTDKSLDGVDESEAVRRAHFAVAGARNFSQVPHPRFGGARFSQLHDSFDSTHNF